MADVVAARIVIPVTTDARRATADISGLNSSLKGTENQIDKTAVSARGLKSQFKTLDQSAKLLGNATEVAGRKQALLKNKIESLLTKGINPANRGVQKLVREYNKLNRVANRGNSILGRSRSVLAALVPGGLAVGLALATRNLVRAASAAEETGQKFRVVFRDIQDEAGQTAQSLARDFALSNEESQRLLSNTADLVTGFGATQEEALELSTAVQRLAADQASFNNLAGGTVQASEAITAALLGERERVKSLGVTISEAAVQQEILSRGQQNLTGRARLLARAQATLTLITQQSQNAIGDFARSSNSAANVMRALQANMADAAVTIGQDMLPGLTDLGIALRDSTKDGGVILGLLRGIAQLASEAARQLALMVKQLDAVANFDFRALARAQAESLPEGERRDALLAALSRTDPPPPPGTQPDPRTRTGPGAGPPTTETTQTRLPGGGGRRRQPSAQSIAARTGNIDALLARQAAAADRQREIIEEAGLNTIVFEEFINRQRQNNLSNFLQQSTQIQNATIDERQQSLQNALNDVLNVETLSNEERLEAQRQFNEQSAALDNERLQKIASVTAQVASAAQTGVDIFAGIGQIRRNQIEREINDLEERGASEEEIEGRRRQLQRKAAVDQKKFQTISAILNTATAVTNALAVQPFPLGLALSILAATKGAVEIGVIQSTPIPAAQFGGSFTVPPGAEADGGLLRVSSGEDINVTPVRETARNGGGGFSPGSKVILQVAGREMEALIIDTVNRGFSNGQIQTTRPGTIKTGAT